MTEREETRGGGGRDQWRDQGVVDGRVEDDGRGDVRVPLREGYREFEDAVAVGSWFGRGGGVGVSHGQPGGVDATGRPLRTNITPHHTLRSLGESDMYTPSGAAYFKLALPLLVSARSWPSWATS